MAYAYKVLRETASGNLRSITRSFAAINYGHKWVKSPFGELFVFTNLEDAKRMATIWSGKRKVWIFECETTPLHYIQAGVHLKELKKYGSEKNSLRMFWYKMGEYIHERQFQGDDRITKWVPQGEKIGTSIINLPTGTATCEKLRLLKPIAYYWYGNFIGLAESFNNECKSIGWEVKDQTGV